MFIVDVIRLHYLHGIIKDSAIVTTLFQNFTKWVLKIDQLSTN